MSSFTDQLYFKTIMPRFALESNATIHIGFIAPFSGEARSWGAPGLLGCKLWQEWLNSRGGLRIGARRYLIRIHSRDCQLDPELALRHAQELIREHNICLVLTHGGDAIAELAPFLSERKLLATTLYPTDISPDTPYLIAPAEVHPIYNVTCVDWIARKRPELKTMAICNQKDALGLPSMAAYRAACKAAKIRITQEVLYDTPGQNPEEIVDAMLAVNPDILCWGTSYTDMVNALTKLAFERGFQGQILSCTFDDYRQITEQTSREFMEGTLFQFPDFNDPKLREKAFFFNRPKTFYDEYVSRFPNDWSAVSWEYVSALDIWRAAVEHAGSINPVSVMAAMKQDGNAMHAFGPAKWWGEDIFGLSNVLIGDWPVVQIRQGKAKIEEFVSMQSWLDKNEALLKSNLRQLGQLWNQRLEQNVPHLRPVKNVNPRPHPAE